MDGANYSTFVAQSPISPIFLINPFLITSEDFIKQCATHQSTSNIASMAHTSNSPTCLSQSPSLGLQVIDSSATNPISSNSSLFSSFTKAVNLPFIMVHRHKLVPFVLPNPSHPLLLTLFYMSLVALLIYCLFPNSPNPMILPSPSLKEMLPCKIGYQVGRLTLNVSYMAFTISIHHHQYGLSNGDPCSIRTVQINKIVEDSSKFKTFVYLWKATPPLLSKTLTEHSQNRLQMCLLKHQASPYSTWLK